MLGLVHSLPSGVLELNPGLASNSHCKYQENGTGWFGSETECELNNHYPLLHPQLDSHSPEPSQLTPNCSRSFKSSGIVISALQKYIPTTCACECAHVPPLVFAGSTGTLVRPCHPESSHTCRENRSGVSALNTQQLQSKGHLHPTGVPSTGKKHQIALGSSQEHCEPCNVHLNSTLLCWRDSYLLQLDAG